MNLLTYFALIHLEIGVSYSINIPVFFLLSNTGDTVKLQAYRKHTIYLLLAPRQSVTEFITQSNTGFPLTEVTCHPFLRCFCVAQHTWDDDSPIRLHWRFRHTTGQRRVKVKFHLKPWKVPVHDRSHCFDVVLESDFCLNARSALPIQFAY